MKRQYTRLEKGIIFTTISAFIFIPKIAKQIDVTIENNKIQQAEQDRLQRRAEYLKRCDAECQKQDEAESKARQYFIEKESARMQAIIDYNKATNERRENLVHQEVYNHFK